MDITSSVISKLLLEIEKVRRRKIADYSTDQKIEYIDTSNNLEKLLVGNNHIIFGRRGCGKTTLILAALKRSQDNIVVPIDIQPIKNDESDDIVLKILIQTLNRQQQRFTEIYSEQEIQFKKEYKCISGFVNLILGRRSKIARDAHFKGNEYRKLLLNEIALLDTLRKKPKEITYTITEEKTKKHESSEKKSSYKETNTFMKLSGNVGMEYKQYSGKIDAIFSAMQSNKNERSNEIKEGYSSEAKTSYEKKYSKSDMLNEQKELVAFLFNEFKTMYGVNIVLYLDDFYQIPIERHPYIIQYFHDVFKYCCNSSFCFKLSALPYRLRMNNVGNVDMSYKDDFSLIKLDNNLSELKSTRDYLLNILVNVDTSLNITKQDIATLFNNEEVLLYSIIATGGIPRDFLLMFSSLIETAKNNMCSTIQKEHIYSVVKSLREDKDNNIEFDSNISPAIIHKSVEILETEVVRQLNTNVILYPKALADKHDVLLKNLVNLRYLHIIRDSTTSESKKKEEFVAYLIDMSFYAVNKKLRPGFDFRKFWEVDNSSRLSQLRQSKIWNFPEDILKCDTIISEKIHNELP